LQDALHQCCRLASCEVLQIAYIWQHPQGLLTNSS
jgi:hypothetical protein